MKNNIYIKHHKTFSEKSVLKNDFLCVPNTRKCFPTIFNVATKHRKMSQFSRKCFLENEWFSKKRFTLKQTEPKIQERAYEE